MWVYFLPVLLLPALSSISETGYEIAPTRLEFQDLRLNTFLIENRLDVPGDFRLVSAAGIDLDDVGEVPYGFVAGLDPIRH